MNTNEFDFQINFRDKILVFTLLAGLSFIFIFIISFQDIYNAYAINMKYDNTTNISNLSNYTKQKTNLMCDCIVFRLDDIQDFWLDKVQSKLLDIFISKNQSLSLAIIANITGKDTKLLSKINQGIKDRLFEITSHGWKHEDFTTIGADEQTKLLSQSVNKINKMFKQNISVFIPPFTEFNNYTINSMNTIGLNIISSDRWGEEDFDNFTSTLTLKGINYGDNHPTKDKRVYHIPATIFFHEYEDDGWIKISTFDIISNITKNISEKGYAVIVLHPQDFSLHSNNKNKTDDNTINKINYREIKDLEKLIDWTLDNGVKITTFEGIVRGK